MIINLLNPLLIKKVKKVYDYFIVRALTANVQFAVKKYGSPDKIDLYYNINDTEWIQYTIGDSIILSNINDECKLWNKNNNFSKDFNNFYIIHFYNTGNAYIDGSVMSLINFDKITEYCFTKLFDSYYTYSSVNRIIGVNKKFLPATKLANYCYNNMFWGCSSISIQPELPCKNVPIHAYSNMFNRCTNLTKADDINVNSLASNACCQMYVYSGLIESPKIHCNNYGYQSLNMMFSYCSNLTKINKITGIALGNQVLQSMFTYCTGLTKIESGIFDDLILSGNTLFFNTFARCTNLETLEPGCIPTTNITTDMFQSCFSNCTKLEEIPLGVLPTENINLRGFKWTFSRCSSLNKITVGFTSWQYYSYQWLDNVSTSGTFICPSSLPQQRGSSYIPQNWTIERY